MNAEAEGAGQALAERFAVDGYPTFVLANAEAETIERFWGFDAADDFVTTLAGAVADPTTIAEKRARFESQPSSRDAAKLGAYHLTRKESAEASDYFERAIELGRPEDGYEYELAMARFIGVRKDEVSLDEFRPVADRALASPHLEPGESVEIARWMIDLLRKQDPAAAGSYVALGLSATEGQDDESLERARRNLLIDEALLVRNDRALAVSLKRESLAQDWESDPDALNGFAWWCFENEANLEEAEVLARRGVELAENDGQKAQILDTLAELVNLRGDREEALALIRQAVELEPDSEYYRKQQEEFSAESVAASDAAGAD